MNKKVFGIYKILKLSVCVTILSVLIPVCMGCDLKIAQDDKGTTAYYEEYVSLVSQDEIWEENWVLYRDEIVIGADEGIDLGKVSSASDCEEQMQLFHNMLNQVLKDEPLISDMTAYEAVSISRTCLISCDSTLLTGDKQYFITGLDIFLYDDGRIISRITYTEDGEEHTMCLYLRFPYDDLAKNIIT